MFPLSPHDTEILKSLDQLFVFFTTTFIVTYLNINSLTSILEGLENGGFVLFSTSYFSVSECALVS